MYAENQCIKAQSMNAGLATAKPASPTLSLLNSLRESQNDTHDAIGRLEAALTEVLAPVPPSPCGVAKEPDCAASTSPLCEELDRRLGVEHSARWRIQSLIDRLTV